jgi:hypothetical protein
MSTAQHSADGRSAIRRSVEGDLWTLLTAIGGLLVGSALVLSGGLLAIALAPLAVMVAIGLATPFALTVCVLLVGAVELSTPLVVLIAGAGLFTIACAGLTETANPFAAVAVLAILTAVLVGLTGVVWGVWPPWLATLSVLVVLAVLGYGTHRYERVMLGLVSDESTEDES